MKKYIDVSIHLLSPGTHAWHLGRILIQYTSWGQPLFCLIQAQMHGNDEVLGLSGLETQFVKGSPMDSIIVVVYRDDC